MKSIAKPVKYSVAVVIKAADRPSRFLLVRRPKDDPDLPNNWGLPATTLASGELPEDAARRVCREKLGCRAAPVRFLGAMLQERNSYDIVLIDIEMVVSGSERPNIKNASTSGTAYIAQKWSSNPADLMQSAQNGSCCSSIFLTERGLLDRSDWITSLVGSDQVS